MIGALAPSTTPRRPRYQGHSRRQRPEPIIAAPHPRAKLTNKKIWTDARRAQKMGHSRTGIGIETPSLETTNELMRQCDLVRTGGGAMVHAAYSRAHPRWELVGNAVITVDDTADLDAARKSAWKTPDLAASCS